MSNQMEILAADPSLADHTADPAAYLADAMGRAKRLLAVLQASRDITAIAELRLQVMAVRGWIVTRKLGRTTELAADEVIRRAERAIAVAIRRGQRDGTIRKSRQHNGNQHTPTRPDTRPGPFDYATKGELIGSGGRVGWYALGDHITDAQFEDAISAAWAEGSLTRANLGRKLGLRTDGGNRQVLSNGDPGWIPDPEDRGGEASIRRRAIIRDMAAQSYTSKQISEVTGTHDGTVRRIAREMGITIPADDAVSVRSHDHDQNRIVEETTHILDGAAMSLRLVDPARLDPGQVREWAASLTASTRAINRFTKTMKETSHVEQA